MTDPLTPPGQSHGAGTPLASSAPPPVPQQPAYQQAAYPPAAYQQHAYPGPAHQAPAYPAGGGQPELPRSTFGLALTGTILGSTALLLFLASTLLPFLFFGGLMGDSGFDEEVTFEESSPQGTLGPPDVDGYTADEVTDAVSEALDAYIYPITAQCPSISTAMAQDLEGRMVVCEGDDEGWTMTLFVVFSDADGAFTVTPY